MHDHPAFAGEREVVPLSGFSGALIALLRDARGRSYVRKAAKTPADSTKLARQADRQTELGALLDGVARMPEVLRTGEADGCYWFDMTFVPGRDGIRYLSDASHIEFDSFTGQIGGIINRFASTADQASPIDVRSAIADKLLDIDRKTAGEFRHLLARLNFAASSIPQTLPRTAAHGDLTLENLIVDRQDKLWLIDTIDSPFDHYWIDLSKLFQDCEGRWFKHRGRALSLGISWELRQRIFRAAQAMDARYPAFHYLLLSLTFARILPYSRTETDRTFVRRRVETFIGACEAALETER